METTRDQEQRATPVDAAVAGGYRAAAMFFLYFVEELETRFGKDVAHDIARSVVRRKGLAAGAIAAREVGGGGIRDLVRAHKRFYPSTKQIEVSDDRYVAEDETCFVCPAWRAAGVSDERIEELGNIYCWGDMAYAQAFNPAITLTYDGRQAEGAARCRWIFTMQKGE